MIEQFLYRTGRCLIASYARLLFQLNVQWHMPLPDGPKIIAPNHPSTTDPFLITLLTQEPIHILIHKTLFKVPVFGRYLRRAGHVPVVTAHGRAAFDAAQRLLEAGHTIAIFPEGAISPLDCGFARPHTGVARLALSTGAPVLPVGIGLDRARIHLIETPVDGTIVYADGTTAGVCPAAVGPGPAGRSAAPVGTSGTVRV
jgi:1-acyl-sn-glycerol-3-phosphate acyltransferase